MNWIRSVLGVALGLAVFLVGSAMPRGAIAEHASGSLTPGFKAGAIAYAVVFAALGGLTAASVAGRRHLVHAAVVGVLIAVLAVIHPWIEPALDARWFDAAGVLLMAPAAALAGWARGRLAGPTPGS